MLLFWCFWEVTVLLTPCLDAALCVSGPSGLACLLAAVMYCLCVPALVEYFGKIEQSPQLKKVVMNAGLKVT